MIREATFSPCGKYRYTLTRIWEPESISKKLFASIGLNPSLADAEREDNTISKEISFGKLWGYKGLIKFNLWPFITPYPKELFCNNNCSVIGEYTTPEYRQLILDEIKKRDIKLVFCGWGTNANKLYQERIQDRAYWQKKLLQDNGLELVCLKRNQDGSPKHPLYVKLTTPLQEYA